MSIFSETVTKAISDYRYLLRRYLGQVERMTKLQQLNLKDQSIYKSDLRLYRTAQAIVRDVEENMAKKELGYYSYSGMAQFAQYLKTYLKDYIVEGDQVIHRARKASRALLKAIQLAATPKERLDSVATKQFFDCNQVVAAFGSDEQFDLHVQMLERQQANNPGFYTRIIAHFDSVRESKQINRSAAAA